MMGRQVADQRRFYDFCLEDDVPADYLLRRIDGLLDLGEVREKLKPHYSHMGRPSVDPELMIRMLIVGYCFAVRSERRLCEEVYLNLAYCWFCRLGLEDRAPDHTIFSLNRHGRFRASDAFRLVFEAVLRRCMAARALGRSGRVPAGCHRPEPETFDKTRCWSATMQSSIRLSRMRRSNLSASTPDSAPKMKSGRKNSATTTPTQAVGSVIRKTSRPTITCSPFMPRWLQAAPAHNRRKFAFLSAGVLITRNGLVNDGYWRMAMRPCNPGFPR